MDTLFFLKMVFVLVGLPIITAFSIAIIIGLIDGDVEWNITK